MEYRFVNDFRGAIGSFAAGDVIELDPGDRLVVDGEVVPVVSDWERNERPDAPAPEPEPADVIDDTADNAPTDEPAAPKVSRRKAPKEQNNG